MTECTLRRGIVVPLRDQNGFTPHTTESSLIKTIGYFGQDDFELFSALACQTKWSLQTILDSIYEGKCRRIGVDDVNEYIMTFIKSDAIGEIISNNLDKDNATDQLFDAGFLVEGEDGAYWAIG